MSFTMIIQMTALKLVEQNVEQLRVANEMEKTAKVIVARTTVVLGPC